MKNFLDENIDLFLQKYAENYFEISDFQNKSKFLQKEILRKIFFLCNNNSTIGLSSANIDEILRFISGK